MSNWPTKVKFNWHIYSADVEDCGYAESDNFGHTTDSPIKFYLRFDKRGELHLCLAKCPLEVLAIEQFKIHARKDAYSSSKITIRTSGELSLTTRNTIWCSLLDDEDWHIKCSITYQEPTLKPDHKHLFVEQITNLRQMGLNSDITLVALVDGMEFPAHKWILAVRSPVFEAMFKHEGLMENVLNRVEIKEVTGEVMEAFLEYIYGGDNSKVGVFAVALFELANKYDIPLLAQACIEAINISNAAELYYLTDLHQKENLKQKTLSFIRKYKMAIQQTRGWKELVKPNAELVYQLVDYL